MKRCSNCGETKPLEEFGMERGRPHARSNCRSCARILIMRWRQEHPELRAAQLERDRERWRKRARQRRERERAAKPAPQRIAAEPIEQFFARRGFTVGKRLARFLASQTSASESTWFRRLLRARHAGWSGEHVERIAIAFGVDVGTLFTAGRPTRWHERGVAMPDFSRANCDGADTELFFSDVPEAIEEAKAFCARCPIRSECAEWAIFAEEFGTWGGMSAKERIEERKLRGINMRAQARCG